MEYLKLLQRVRKAIALKSCWAMIESRCMDGQVRSPLCLMDERKCSIARFPLQDFLKATPKK
jgi:hypothetical protein